MEHKKCPTPALYFVPAIVMTDDVFAMRQIGNIQNGPAFRNHLIFHCEQEGCQPKN